MNNREEFEAWVRENKPTFSLSISSSKPDQYNYVSTNYLWLGWNAALASQQQDHIPDGGEMVEQSLGNTEQLKLVQAVNALAAQTGESPESIIEWLTDKGGLTTLMLSHFGGMQSQAQQTEKGEAIAKYLYQLLDDIDTAGDIAKENDKAYRAIVERIQSKKSKVVESCDGYTVVFKLPPAPEGGA